MNSLLSSSFGSEASSGSVPMSPAAGTNLDRFFEDVESVKNELQGLESLHRSLQEANDTSKSLQQASAVRALRERMDADVSAALRKAQHVKLCLEALDQANAANRSLPGCGPGSSTDRTRTSVVGGLCRKLKDTVESFVTLRGKVQEEYREAVERRYYAVTGTVPDDSTLEVLMETGESERFLRVAIEQQGGRGDDVVMDDVVAEIRERHGAAKEIQRSLVELHQVFLQMSVAVNVQGDQLVDIESQLDDASSFVKEGTEGLQQAETTQRNTRSWTCIAISIAVFVVVVIAVVIAVVLTVVLSNNNKGNASYARNVFDVVSVGWLDRLSLLIRKKRTMVFGERDEGLRF